MTFKQYDEKGVCRMRVGLNETTFYNEKGEVTLTLNASNPVVIDQQKREWVGLEPSDWPLPQYEYSPDFQVGAQWAADILKEKNK